MAMAWRIVHAVNTDDVRLYNRVQRRVSKMTARECENEIAAIDKMIAENWYNANKQHRNDEIGNTYLSNGQYKTMLQKRLGNLNNAR